MSIRERQLNSVAYISGGGTSLLDLPKDSCYHWFTLSCFGGSFAVVQGAGGTGPTLVPGFPFTLMRQVRLIRNGSDIVASMSGEQLAKEHYYLNKQHPFARLYTVTSNVETLATATVRGITIPGNTEGIGAGGGGYAVPNAPNATGTLLFDFQADLMLQISAEDAYYSTLVDARPLAAFQLQIDWAAEAAQIAAAGVTNGATTASFTLNILSIDQDNLDVKNAFGTFKRSVLSYSNLPYGSANNQILLPKGNFVHGIMFGTKAYKAGSTANLINENSVLSTIEHRINTSFSLRKTDFRQLQAKNMADGGSGRNGAFSTAQGEPQGYAYLSYHHVGHKASEMVPSYVADTFDLQLSTQTLASSTNGVTTASTNPLIELLLEEVIPGVSISDAMPQGAQAGSIGKTSAKLYSR